MQHLKTNKNHSLACFKSTKNNSGKTETEKIEFEQWRAIHASVGGVKICLKCILPKVKPEFFF